MKTIEDRYTSLKMISHWHIVAHSFHTKFYNVEKDRTYMTTLNSQV